MTKSGVREPVQNRSKKTHNDLLDALERSLREKPITTLTVAEISREAGLTTGAIYRRFKDKQALLQAAFVRFSEKVAQDLQINANEFEQESDEAILKFVISKMLYDTLDYIPLMQAASTLNDLPSFDKMVAARNMVADKLALSLTTSELSPDQLKRQCRFVVRMVTAVIRDTFMAGQGASKGIFSKEQILLERKQELEQLFHDLFLLHCLALQKTFVRICLTKYFLDHLQHQFARLHKLQKKPLVEGILQAQPFVPLKPLNFEL